MGTSDFTDEPTDVQVFVGGKATFLCVRMDPGNREWKLSNIGGTFNDFQALTTYRSAGLTRVDRNSDGTGITWSDVVMTDDDASAQCKYTDSPDVSAIGILHITRGKHRTNEGM